MFRRKVVSAAIAAALCSVVSLAATVPLHAQAKWPTRPMTLVVPYPAGGPADLLCRYAAEKVTASVGQMVVENRPGGAGGRIGIDQVLRSAPDGYTFLCGTQLNYSVSHLVFAKSGFDPRPLEPISVLATYPLIIILRKDFPANTMAEFFSYAKANPGKINYGHQGIGNTGHLLGELMMLKAGFKMTAVPYRGSAPGIKDLLGGTIDMMPDYLLANKGNIDAGRLKFIAVASRERLKDYPKVPTIAETLPGVYSITWMAVSAPPKTPKEITRKISDAIAKGFKEPELQARIRKLEATPRGTTPQGMLDMIKQSHDTWEPVIKAANIRVN